MFNTQQTFELNNKHSKYSDKARTSIGFKNKAATKPVKQTKWPQLRRLRLTGSLKQSQMIYDWYYLLKTNFAIRLILHTVYEGKPTWLTEYINISKI